MGMFDTFWGKYKCPNCEHTVQFEEQTKRYECILEDFYLGDYVDRGNRNYFYDFEHECPVCHSNNEVYIAIRRGQYVGVYVGRESSEMEITKLENIEDGYARRRAYDHICERKLGYDNPIKSDEPLEQRHVGDHITALKTDWEILEVYKEVLDDDVLNSGRFFRSFYEDNFIYRVVSGEDRRIVAVRKHEFTREIRTNVSLDDFTSELRTKYVGSENEDAFVMQSQCKLVRIE